MTLNTDNVTNLVTMTLSTANRSRDSGKEQKRRIVYSQRRSRWMLHTGPWLLKVCLRLFVSSARFTTQWYTDLCELMLIQQPVNTEPGQETLTHWTKQSQHKLWLFLKNWSRWRCCWSEGPVDATSMLQDCLLHWLGSVSHGNLRHNDLYSLNYRHLSKHKSHLNNSMQKLLTDGEET